MRTLPFFVLVLVAVGCGSSPTYECQVINRTTQPLSVGMVHHAEEGMLPQADWAGPEHIAMVPNNVMHKQWGSLVNPGEMVTLGPRVGPPPGSAVLRAYRSNGTVENLTGYARDDPGRVDAAIYPGKNAIVLIQEKGRLVAEHSEYQQAAPTPK